MGHCAARGASERGAREATPIIASAVEQLSNSLPAAARLHVLHIKTGRRDAFNTVPLWPAPVKSPFIAAPVFCIAYRRTLLPHLLVLALPCTLFLHINPRPLDQ